MEFRYRLKDIEETARDVYEACKTCTTWAFYGPMGAGKTTFIHALCSVLGVKDTVSSPTFAIVNEYKAPGGNIYHMDWYRLKDEEEALQAGVEDYLYSNDLCLVEWPQKAAGLLPEHTMYIHIDVIDEFSRVIKIELPSLPEKN